MKTCFKCSEEKPLSSFYKHKQMLDGHLNKCIQCTKKDVIQHRRDNSEAVREYDRKRYQQPHRKRLGRESVALWRQNNVLGYKAHTAVSNAVRDGKLKREPCLFCGIDQNIHAHHKDYSKPLEVVWLCAKCHHRLHANFPETEAHEKRL